MECVVELKSGSPVLSCPLSEHERCMCGLQTEEFGGRQVFPEGLSSSVGKSKGN